MTLAVMMGKAQKGRLRPNQSTVDIPNKERSGQYNASSRSQVRPKRGEWFC